MTGQLSRTVLDLCTEDDQLHGLALNDEVLRRAKLLPDEPRNLLFLVLTGKISQREMARMKHQHPGCLSRKIRTLRQRLLQPIAQRLADHGHLLSDNFRHLAIHHFLLGKNIPSLSRETGIPPSDLRSILNYIKSSL
jgi:hypothetical protein